MKTVWEFFKTTVLGGLLVLLPLLIFYLLMDELIGVFVALATPIAGLFPEGYFDHAYLPLVVAILLIVFGSFVFGLALRSTLMRRFGDWVERVLLEKLPMYKAVKRLSRGLAGERENQVFTPALFQSDDHTHEVVYVVEEIDNDRLAILVPMAPAGFSGPVKIVSRDKVIALDASIGDASQVLAHWGHGMGDLVARTRASDPGVN